MLFCVKTQAQETQRVPKHQIELQHDNDFILLTDRYYSSGLFLNYKRRLSNGIFATDSEQISFELQQLAHTPTNIEAIDTQSYDRPYAGFTGLETGWSLTQSNTMYGLSLLVGITGPASGAGQFQQWYHDNIVLYKTPVWFTEIENSFHLNLQGSWIKEWELNPNPFSVHIAFAPKIAIGTKDIYAQPEVIAFFGKRNQLANSIAYNQINATQKELFFALRMGYRFVAHNAFLEGNLLGDTSRFTVPSSSGVLRLGFDVQHRVGQNDYTLGYRYLSKETPTVENHQYLQLSYGRSF